MKKDRIAFGFLTALLMVALWYYQYYITINIPFWDDFHGVMLPVYDLFSDLSIWDKFKSFFSLNNEHRVVNDRIFSTLLYVIFGRFELKYLALLGFLNLILIFYLYFKTSKSTATNYLYFLPLSLLIFQAKYSEGLQFLMVPFQNFSVILYSYACFYFLIYKKINRLIPAAIFATMAFYSHGNGVLAFVVGGFILICYEDRRPLWKWLIFSILSISIYFIGYQKPSWTDAPEMQVSLIAKVMYVFEFIGSYFLIFVELSQRLLSSPFIKIIPAFFGVVLVIAFAAYFATNYLKKYSSLSEGLRQLTLHKGAFFLVSTIVFFGCTAIIMGMTRAGFVMFSRYTINSAFILCSIYLLLLPRVKYKGLFAVVCSLVFSFGCFFSYFNNVPSALFFKQTAIYDAYNWKNNGTWAAQYSDSAHVSRLNPLLTSICKNEKYKFPKEVEEIDLSHAKEGKIQVKDLKLVDKYLEILVEDNTSENILCLKNANYCFLMPAFKIKSSIATIIKTGKYYSGLNRFDFPIYVIPNEAYEIILYQKTSQGLLMSNTNMILQNRQLSRI